VRLRCRRWRTADAGRGRSSPPSRRPSTTLSGDGSGRKRPDSRTGWSRQAAPSNPKSHKQFGSRARQPRSRTLPSGWLMGIPPFYLEAASQRTRPPRPVRRGAHFRIGPAASGSFQTGHVMRPSARARPTANSRSWHPSLL
jgi:hypothetical protein